MKISFCRYLFMLSIAFFVQLFHILDVILFFGRKQNWPSQNGGFISYFSSGEEDEIIRVIPTLNTAAIVFRFFF